MSHPAYKEPTELYLHVDTVEHEGGPITIHRFFDDSPEIHKWSYDGATFKKNTTKLQAIKVRLKQYPFWKVYNNPEYSDERRKVAREDARLYREYLRRHLYS